MFHVRGVAVCVRRGCVRCRPCVAVSHYMSHYMLLLMLVVRMMRAGPAISTAPEDLIAALTQGGYETMETAQRVQLLVYLCEDACETAGINRHLDEAIEETRELSNEMREEEKKLREQKKQAKLEKAKAKEQAMNTLKNDGDDDKKEDEDEKPKVSRLPGPQQTSVLRQIAHADCACAAQHDGAWLAVLVVELVAPSDQGWLIFGIAVAHGFLVRGMLLVAAHMLLRAWHVQEKETAALKKAKLAETKEKMREEDAKLEEQEKALQVNAPVRALPCRTPQPGRCVAYAPRPCSARATVLVQREKDKRRGSGGHGHTRSCLWSSHVERDLPSIRVLPCVLVG